MIQHVPSKLRSTLFIVHTNFSDSFLYESVALFSLAFRNLSSATLTLLSCDLHQNIKFLPLVIKWFAVKSPKS